MTKYVIFGCIIATIISTCIAIIKYKEVESLKEKLTICSAQVTKLNEAVNVANNLNVEQNKIIVKYNQMKKKDYNNETDADLNALHNLDVLLEQTSIIDDIKTPSSDTNAN